MHPPVLKWLRQVLPTLSPRLRVLEIGSKNINGSAREVIDTPEAPVSRYVGIDPADGPGVDVVADGETYRPDFAPDTVVCCEVFEHTPRWPQILEHVYELLEPGGFVLLTMATDPRLPHSAVHGGPLQEGEYYANVPPVALVDTLRSIGYEMQTVAVNDARGDLYAAAYKPERE